MTAGFLIHQTQKVYVKCRRRDQQLCSHPACRWATIGEELEL